MGRQRALKTKPEARREPDRFAPNVIRDLLGAAALPNWRTPFETEHLYVHHRLDRRSVGYSEMMARSDAIRRVDVRPEVMHAIFGTDRPDHAFDEEPLKWGFGLTERMATETLARFLTAGCGATRARRAHAFLQAVGLPEDCASLDALQRCVVIAEEDRIDLKIVWIDERGKDVVVIIEAKFGHKITEGQLAAYRATVERMHRNEPYASILLTLDDSVCTALKGKQRTIWKQVDWRNFWLRFERLRPVEHNPSFQMFLSTLWHRAGRLTQEDRHGKI